MAKLEEIVKSFETGAFKDVLDQTIDASTVNCSAKFLAPIVGSLIFLGRRDDARILFEKFVSKLSTSTRIESQFFLGIGNCRHSLYQAARKYFSNNIRELRGKLTHRDRFFAFQGKAFYRYFCGRYAVARDYASRAYEEALSAGFTYGRILALDLRGHTLIQCGQVSLGIRNLTNAAELARGIGATAIESMSQLSIIQARAEFGLAPKTAVQELEAAIADNDGRTFERAGLRLELARQLQLRGKISAANETLAKAAPEIHGFQHRRYDAQLNLRYAMSQIYSGEFHLALNLVNNAYRCLDPSVDSALALKILGLERFLCEITFREFSTAKNAEIDRLKRITGCGVANRIDAREGRKAESAYLSLSDDPLGDLIDLVTKSPVAACETIERTGYVGLLPKLKGCAYGKRALVLNMLRERLVVFSPADIFITQETFPRSLAKVLLSLAHGELDKESLFRSAWEYSEYHPLKSDPLIYATISRLRKHLASQSYWLEKTDAGYRIAPGVDVIDYETYFRSRYDSSGSSKQSMKRKTRGEAHPRYRLNTRQHRVLEYLQTHKSIDARTYRKEMGTSEITATRDLSELYRLNLLRRVGHGRSVRYEANQFS